MKKTIAIVAALAMAVSMAACGTSAETTTAAEAGADLSAKSEGVMTYEEYNAAAVDDEVTVECYVQAHQSWWDEKVTVYAQDPDGGYFMYDMACSEEDAEKLVPGTKIRVTGYKSDYAGEIEIADATFEFVDDGTSYIADPVDCTDLLGTDELINYQNQYVYFTGLNVDEVAYKNDTPGDDIYVTVSKDGQSYDFCLEYYLNGDQETFYDSVGTLAGTENVTIFGYLYWYNGVNTHITSFTLPKE